MSRTFGWSLPPGCGTLPGEEPEPPCAVCAKPVDACVCPECPTCGSNGDPRCYCPVSEEGHGMRLTRSQVIGRQEARIHQVTMSLQAEQEALDEMRGGGAFSDDITDNPDPWR